jgi:hypothetical protein
MADAREKIRDREELEVAPLESLTGRLLNTQQADKI